jgi:Regulator of chromosome condensation (RCC1) repeat
VRSVDQTACAILDSGEITCWGNNDRGFLARGDIGGFDALAGRSRVKLVGGATLAGAVEFVGAPTVYQQFCAKLADGRYACWGNSYGALSFASIVKRDDNQQPFVNGISQVMSTGAYVDSAGVLRRSFQYSAGNYIADTAQRASVYTTVCPSIP